MSTRNSGQNLCDNCRQKPKFGNHNFCGKACAQQAGSLCDFCHQKPKFGGHDYCSKYCGSQAKAQAGGSGQGRGRGGGKRGQGRGQGSGPGTAAMLAAAGQQALGVAAQVLPHLGPTGAKFAIAGQALQAALPQLQQMLLQPQGGNGRGSHGAKIQPVAITPVPQVPRSYPVAANSGTGKAAQTIPGAYQVAAQPFANTTNFPEAQSFAAPSKTCGIPGCTQPVHVDPAGGYTSSYCSMLHRQEAVQLGVADACIMCLKFPQSGDDHFCGKACRDEALSAPA